MRSERLMEMRVAEVRNDSMRLRSDFLGGEKARSGTSLSSKEMEVFSNAKAVAVIAAHSQSTYPATERG